MNRAMRLIVMFDLPSVTKKELRYARKWHKYLVSNGFIMMTESVYSKLVINKSISESVRKKMISFLPPKGEMHLLEITERQFSKIEYLLGKKQNKTIDSTERYLEI